MPVEAQGDTHTSQELEMSEAAAPQEVAAAPQEDAAPSREVSHNMRVRLSLQPYSLPTYCLQKAPAVQPPEAPGVM